MEKPSESKFVAKKWPQILAALAATLGGFQLGLMNGWTSPGLPDLEERGDLGELSTNEISWIASLSSLGCLFSVYPSGYSIQKFGRHPVMVYASIPFTIGWLLLAYATNVEMIYAGRFLTGFCSGVYGVASPVYIAECSEASIRGALGSCFQLLIVTGILFSYSIGAGVSWSWLAVISIVPTLATLLVLLLVPESPRYLLTKGQHEAAKKSLMWLRGADNFEQVEEEYEMVKENVEYTSEASFKELLKPSVLKPTSIGFLLMMFQQLCGIDAVTFFTVSIFDDAGATLDPNMSAIIVGVVQVFFTFLAVGLIDKVGRRILLLSSNVVLVISLFGLGLFFFIQEEGEPVKQGWLPLASLVIYISAFSVGIGPLAWLFIGEVLPNHIIGIASSLATSVLWILSFLVIRFFEPVNDALGQEVTFWFFSVMTAVSTVYVYFFLPETKGKTLDEVQEFFGERKLSLKKKPKEMIQAVT